VGSGCRTSAVRFGAPRSRKVEHGLFLSGLCLLGGATSADRSPTFGPSVWLILSLLTLLTVLVVATTVQVYGNPPSNIKQTLRAYCFVRLWIVGYASALLRLPPRGAAFVLWAFVTRARS